MTPESDRLLEEYYANQKPGMRTCAETGASFEITEAAFGLYKKLGVPLPTVAPHVRLRRLRAHMGGIELFPRTIDGAQIITMYDPESPAALIDERQWYQDSHDAMQYGREIRPNEAFFEQWKAFSPTVPLPATISDPESDNCSWSLYELEFKNCYATYGGVRCSDLLYGDMCIDTSNTLDAAFMVQSEWLYDCIEGFGCSQTFFSDSCVQCRDVYFSYGCNNCTDCFACVNLENKQYCILNVQYSKEEYFETIKKFDLSDTAVVQRLKKEAATFWQKGYTCAENNIRSERSNGYDVVDSADTVGISTFKTERLYNAFDVALVKDSCDLTTCSALESSVNSVVCTDGFENKMSVSCTGCIDVEYSLQCISCEHCFGCVGLKRKKYCIFNVQYSKEEYWKKVDEIKAKMIARGEYGQFFPYGTSLLAYNTSHAGAFFPLTQKQIEELGGRFYKQKTITPDGVANTVPQKMSKVDDDILSKQFVCSETQRPYRIVKPELDFHKRFNIALPTVHPSVRRKKRYAKMQGLELKELACHECGKKMMTRMDQMSSRKNVCGTCYKKLLQENLVNLG